MKQYWDKYKYIIIGLGILFWFPAKILGLRKIGMIVFLSACLLGKFKDFRQYLKEK